LNAYCDVLLGFCGTDIYRLLQVFDLCYRRMGLAVRREHALIAH
jgi:hypothetical protein